MMSGVRLWDGPLTPELIAGQVAASGVGSPPPPPPSPPPWDSTQPDLLTSRQLFNATREASLSLANDFNIYARLTVDGRQPGEPPLLVTTDRLHALLYRTSTALIRGTTLNFTMPHTSMPLTVAIPPTIQLQATYQATSTTNETSVHLDEDEAIDVFLISWGADIHGWRLEKPSNVAHVLSNVTSIVLQRASDGAPLRLQR